MDSSVHCPLTQLANKIEEYNKHIYYYIYIYIYIYIYVYILSNNRHASDEYFISYKYPNIHYLYTNKLCEIVSFNNNV